MKIPRPHLPRSKRGWALIAIVTLLIVGLSAGGGWAWRRHKIYQASPLATIDNLNSALANKDAALFAQAVDTNALSTNLVQTLMSLPDSPLMSVSNDPEELHRRANQVQMILLAFLQGKEMPRYLNQAIVPIMPEDLLQQLTQAPFTITAPLAGNILLSYAETTFRHPAIDKPLPLRLMLRQDPSGWVVVRILNVGEIANAYQEAVEAELRRRKEKEGLTLEEHRKALARYLPDITCEGGITRISGQLPMLILKVQTGVTPGPETVTAWGLGFSLMDASGKTLVTPRITSSDKVEKGSGVTDAWNVEIPEETYQQLENAGPLTCRATPEYVILSNGKIFKDIQH